MLPPPKRIQQSSRIICVVAQTLPPWSTNRTGAAIPTNQPTATDRRSEDLWSVGSVARGKADPGRNAVPPLRPSFQPDHHDDTIRDTYRSGQSCARSTCFASTIGPEDKASQEWTTRRRAIFLRGNGGTWRGFRGHEVSFYRFFSVGIPK